MKFYDHVNDITAVGRRMTSQEIAFGIRLKHGTYLKVTVVKSNSYRVFYNSDDRTVVAHHPKADYIDVTATILETAILFLTGEHAYLEEDE